MFVAVGPSLARSGSVRVRIKIALVRPDLPSLLFFLLLTCCSPLLCFVARHGQNYYRVQGHDVKEIQATEWLNVKPRMALFVLDDDDRAGGSAGARAGAGIGAGIGARHARKRRRVEERQQSYFSRPSDRGEGGGGGMRMSSSSSAAAVAGAEVIEVNDDDSDHEENSCEIVPAAAAGGVPAVGRTKESSCGTLPADAFRRTAAVGRTAAAGDRASGRSDSDGCNDCEAPVVTTEAAVPAGERPAEPNHRLSRGAAGGVRCEGSGGRWPRESPPQLLGADDEEAGASAGKTSRVAFGSDGNGELYEDDARRGWNSVTAQDRGKSAADIAVSKSFLRATDASREFCATAARLEGKPGLDASRRSFLAPLIWTPCITRGARGGDSGRGSGSAGGGTGRTPAEPSHEDLTAREDGPEIDEGDDDVQVVTTGQTGPGIGEGGGSSTASSSTPSVEGGGRAARKEHSGNGDGNREGSNGAPSAKGDFGAGAADATVAVAPASCLTSRSDEGRPSDYPVPAGAEIAARVAAVSARASPWWLDDQQQQQREVHHVDDDVSAGPPPASSSDNAAVKLAHPSGVSMPFMGPVRPPPRPSREAGKSPRLRFRRPIEQLRHFLTQESETKKSGRRPDGGGGTGDIGQQKIKRLSPWGRADPLSDLAPDHDGIDADGDEEWRPLCKERKSSPGVGGGVDVADRRRTRSSGSGVGGGGGAENAMEDLTGAEHGSPPEEASGGAGDRAWASRLRGGGGSREDETTLTTIRGINLQQDHFDRVVDSDGWLTSQVIFRIRFFFCMGRDWMAQCAAMQSVWFLKNTCVGADSAVKPGVDAHNACVAGPSEVLRTCRIRDD